MKLLRSVPEATDHCRPVIDLAHVRAGQPFVLIEEIGGQCVGMFSIAAQFATADRINQMAREARGLICLALHETIVDQLGLPLMMQRNRMRRGPAYTVSIEARHGVSTGISTQDRANTIAAAICDGASAEQIASPGHIFPIRVEEDDLRVRSSSAAMAVGLCVQAGLKPAAVQCAILNSAGAVADPMQLRVLAAELCLPIARCRDVSDGINPGLVRRPA